MSNKTKWVYSLALPGAAVLLLLLYSGLVILLFIFAEPDRGFWSPGAPTVPSIPLIDLDQDFTEVYENERLNFRLTYPAGWKIEESILSQQNRNRTVQFSAAIARVNPLRPSWDGDDQCDLGQYDATIEVREMDSFGHASFGSVANREDIKDFLDQETSSGVIDIFPLGEGNALITARAYSGSGFCHEAQYIGLVGDDNQIKYWITFSGDEDWYEIAKAFFSRFELIDPTKDIEPAAR